MKTKQLPTGWKEVELGEICEITSSKRIYQNEYVNEGIPFYRSKEVIELSKDKLISIELFISKKRYEDLKEKFGIPQKGELLITAIGTIGVSYVIPNNKEFYFKDGNLLWIRKISKINPIYLNYFLSNHFKKNKNDMTSGSAYNALTIVNLKKLKIPLPPLPTQKHIVSILEKAEKLKQKREQADKLTKEYLQSVFYEMFGDPVKNPKKFPIVEIREIVSCAEYGTSKKADEIENGIPIIRMNNITYDGEWDFSELKYIKFDEKETQKYLLNKGDLLFNRTNSKELVGKTAVYRSNKKMVYAGYLIRIKTNEKSSSEYISAYLNSNYGKKILFNMCKNIVGMANINAQELQNIKIPLPPIELQQTFASIVKHVEKLKEKQKRSKEEINNLFNSLMQKAFKGWLGR